VQPRSARFSGKSYLGGGGRAPPQATEAAASFRFSLHNLAEQRISHRHIAGENSLLYLSNLQYCPRVDISELIAQKPLPMAGSPFDDLVTRVEREFSILDKARRVSEGIASTAASLNWFENIERTINPAQSFCDDFIRPYEGISRTIGETYSKVFADANMAATGMLSEWKRYYELTLGQTVGEFYAKFFDYNRNLAAGIFSELQRYNELIRSITEQFSDDVFIDLELHLIDEGWYLSIDLPASVVLDLADLHDEQKFEEIEQWLRRFYRQKVNYVQPEILSAFPHRRRILESAFAAHRRREYALSIPVFLNQADGISSDLWQENFFRPRRSNRRIDKILQGRDSGLSVTVLRHLYQQGSLRASFKPGNSPTRLNRHAVIHGTSTDYDTEENSLRCIALLEFLMSLQPLFDRDSIDTR
jgi:hypothetical protein